MSLNGHIGTAIDKEAANNVRGVILLSNTWVPFDDGNIILKICGLFVPICVCVCVCVCVGFWFLLSQAKLSIHFLFWVLDSLGLRVSCWVLLGFVAV